MTATELVTQYNIRIKDLITNVHRFVGPVKAIV